MNIFRRAPKTIVTSTGPTADEIDAVERIQLRFGTIIFGAPTRCADCGGYGMVERIDEVAGVSDNRCPACAAEWRITRAALTRVNRPSSIDLRADLRSGAAMLQVSGQAVRPQAMARSLGGDGLDGRPVGDGILIRDLVSA